MTLEISLLPLQRLSIHPRTCETKPNQTPKPKAKTQPLQSSDRPHPSSRVHATGKTWKGAWSSASGPSAASNDGGGKTPGNCPPLGQPSFHRTTGNFLKKKTRRGQRQQRRSICLGAIKVVSHLLDSPPRRNPDSRTRNSHPVCTVLRPDARRRGCQEFPRA